MDLGKLFDQHGQFVGVRFRSEKKPSAKHKGMRLEKVTQGVFRAGIRFENLGAVKEAIENGERGEVQPLPWGEWEVFPYTIRHKGKRYVRLYPPFKRNDQGELVPDWDAANIKSQHFVNGQEVTKEEFNSYLTPSQIKSSDMSFCFTVKEENVDITKSGKYQEVV